MALQIVPNLKALKGQIENQNRMQTLAQGLQGYSDYAQQEQAKKQTEEAYRGMKLDSRVRFLPEEARKAYFKKEFPEALTEVEKSQKALNEAKTKEALAKAEKHGRKSPGETYFEQMMKASEPKKTEMEEPVQKEPVIGKGILKPGAQLKPKAAKTKPKEPEERKPYDPMDKSTWSDDQLRQMAALKGEKGYEGIQGQAAQLELDFREKEKKEKKETKEKKEKEDIRRKEYFDKKTEEFDEELIKSSQEADEKLRAIDMLESKVDDLTWWDRFVSNLFGDQRWANMLLSKNAQEFNSNSLPLLKGWKQILGGVLSDSDIRLIMQKVASSGKDPKANKSILKFQRLENDILKARADFGRQIKRKNDNYRPANYEDQINQMVNEQFKDRIQQTYDEIKALDSDGAVLAKIARNPVPAGTIPSKDVYMNYVKMARSRESDPARVKALAKRWAKEDGYDIGE